MDGRVDRCTDVWMAVSIYLSTSVRLLITSMNVCMHNMHMHTIIICISLL